MLFIGLGNPGGEYGSTRHNIGRMVVAALQRKRVNVPAHHLGNVFMNQSGQAAAALLGNQRPESLIVIHDDMDLSLGTVRIRQGGGSAGHNGVTSIIEALGTEGFWRVRIGISRPPEGQSAEDYVLQPFAANETPLVKATLDLVVTTLINSLKLGLSDQTLVATS